MEKPGWDPRPQHRQGEMNGAGPGWRHRREAGTQKSRGQRRCRNEPARSVAWARRPLPFSAASANSSQQSPWQPPPEAAAVVINIYFAVTHTPDLSTGLCQERSQECLSHSRNASVDLLGGGTAGGTFRLTVYTPRHHTHRLQSATSRSDTKIHFSVTLRTILSYSESKGRAHVAGGSPVCTPVWQQGLADSVLAREHSGPESACQSTG